jgi:hypothetical protein
VFVVGKNYRLQDIQLSKMLEALSGQLAAASWFERRFAASFSQFSDPLAAADVPACRAVS